jgi:hypothetical protein
LHLLHLQALEHYGESIRVGHKHILQSLPRLLTLYFEFGSKVAASKAMNQKMRNTHTQVCRCCCRMQRFTVGQYTTELQACLLVLVCVLLWDTLFCHTVHSKRMCQL